MPGSLNAKSRGRLLFRKGVLALIAGGCPAVGAALLWAWLDPARIAEADQAQIGALLGLFVLPAATTAAVIGERRARRAQTLRRECERDRVLRHGAHPEDDARAARRARTSRRMIVD